MKYILKNCLLFDGNEMNGIMEHQNIYVNGERIERVTESIMDTEGYEIVDLSGKYVMPGLINLHAHLFGSGKPSKTLGGGGMQKQIIHFCSTKLGRNVVKRMLKTNMKNALLSGCTTVRGVGDFFYSDVQIRNQINEKKAIGPRLLVSGPAITVPGGHGDGTFSVTGSTEEELRKRTDENHRNQVNLIKICVTGGVMDAKVKGEPGVVKMSLKQTKAVCHRAHELGYQVASHTESPEGVIIALKGGVDTIEHGSKLSEEAIQLFHEKNAALTCTISPALPLAKFPPEVTMLNELCVYNSEVVLDNMIEGTKTALANHIPVGLGTDASCPFATQYNMWRELYYFAKMIGVTNAFALQTATLTNAQILHIDDITGSIAAGKSADMIVTDQNPLENLTVLRNLSMVIARGKRYPKPKVKKNEKIEEMLDTLL